MSDNLCCFCLGDNLDIPPFGNILDAQDFVSPCGTCTIQAHRRCLLEWYNSKRAVKVVHGDVTSIAAAIARGDVDVDDEDSGADSTADRDLRIQVEFNTLRSWFSNLFNPAEPQTLPTELSLHDYVLLRCPQCKKHLVFSTKRSGALDNLSQMKAATTNALQCGAVMAGVSAVVAGVASVGVVGLTSWGTSIMHYIIPGQLQVGMLTKRYAPKIGGFGSRGAYSVFTSTSTLDKALERGVIDPMRVAHIPLLPVVMYMLPTTSIVELFEKTGKEKVLGLMNEFTVSSYLSSLGGHELIRQVWRNVKRLAIPGAPVSLFHGVDFWSPGVMISLLVPARWTYDILFRLTFNRAHLEVTKTAAPRDISNHLTPDLATTLEELSGLEVQQDADIQIKRDLFRREAEKRWKSLPEWIRQFSMLGSVYMSMRSGLFFAMHYVLSPTMWNHIKTKLLYWVYKLKACFAHDFSTNSIGDSITLKAFSTLMWPILSGELGKVVSKIVSHSFRNVSRDKVVLLSNLISLVVVVIAKDCIDLYIAHKRAEQVLDMQVIITKKVKAKKSNDDADASESTDTEDHLEDLPGAYRQ